MDSGSNWANRAKAFRGRHAQTSPEMVIRSGHSEVIRSLAFSKDSNWLASSAQDDALKLWDMATARLARTIACPELVLSLGISSAIGTSWVEAERRYTAGNWTP